MDSTSHTHIVRPPPSYHNHASEDFTTDQWKQHKKHFFILSETGRPIFTRYGNENELNPIMSFFMAAAALAKSQEDDNLRTVISGDMKMVYLQRGALYFVAVSKTSETEQELSKQLSCLYDQIICILTDNIQGTLKKRATFDLRNLLGGTDAVLYSLIHRMSHTLAFHLSNSKPLMMPKQTRTMIGDVLMRNRVPKLMFSLLLSGDRLVHLISHKKYTMHMSDLLLLSNFVNSSSSMRSMETWTPVCLPALSSAQYTYAYVNFIPMVTNEDDESSISSASSSSPSSTLSSSMMLSSSMSSSFSPMLSLNRRSHDLMTTNNDLCLVMICMGQDLFFECSDARKQIETQLRQNDALFSQLKKAVHSNDFPVSRLGVMSEGASLRHFMYRNPALSQYTTSAFVPPYNIPSESKRLVREYKLVRQNMNFMCAKNNVKIYFHKTQHECILGMNTGSGELVAAFSLTTSKSSALLLCESIKKWVRREEDTLFISSIPTFNQ